mgnify:CR=1 FL=1
MYEKYGVVVTSSFRSKTRQAQMRKDWDEGRRTGLLYKPALKSAHSSGFAIDMNVSSLVNSGEVTVDELSDFAKEYGFNYGGWGYSDLPDATWTGYRFLGWSTNKTGPVNVTVNDNVYTLKCKYKDALNKESKEILEDIYETSNVPIDILFNSDLIITYTIKEEKVTMALEVVVECEKFR